MDDFNHTKKECLSKLYQPDKSRKGTVDEGIIPLIEYLNGLNNYYTTSSCSGRIYVMTEADAKPESKWLFMSHDPVTEEQVISSLKDIPRARVWLRQENLILHVACRTVEDADALLKIARDIGFRRSGIIADSNVIIVEICSTEKVDVPVADEGTLLVPEAYIRFLVRICNEKFLRGREKLTRLEKEIREKLQ